MHQQLSSTGKNRYNENCVFVVAFHSPIIFWLVLAFDWMYCSIFYFLFSTHSLYSSQGGFIQRTTTKTKHKEKERVPSWKPMPTWLPAKTAKQPQHKRLEITFMKTTRGCNYLLLSSPFSDKHLLTCEVVGFSSRVGTTSFHTQKLYGSKRMSHTHLKKTGLFPLLCVWVWGRRVVFFCLPKNEKYQVSESEPPSSCYRAMPYRSPVRRWIMGGFCDAKKKVGRYYCVFPFLECLSC